MPARIIRDVCIVTALVLFLTSYAMLPAHAEKAVKQGETNCDIHHGSCSQTVGERTVELDISPKPVSAMADLTFRVTVTGGPLPDAPYIDLGMPGMEMGPNRVLLKKIDEATYEGTGVIVRCPSGKRIWRAAVTLPDTGAAEFVFDVIY